MKTEQTNIPHGTLPVRNWQRLSRLRAIDADSLAAVSFLNDRLPAIPRAAVILGSGLGSFVDSVEPQVSVPYAEIPGFPISTAMGHAGQLHFVEIFETPVVLLQGRCHLYEGCSRRMATRAVRTLCGLGIETLIVSCAAGGLNPRFSAGDLMLIDSHLDLLGGDCTEERCEPVEFYPEHTLRRAEQAAIEEQVVLRRGTYVAVQGPNYETRAELRYLRQAGGDAVGMSSIPEIVVARGRGVQVFGLATITNECRPDAPAQTSGAAVLSVAGQSEPSFRKLVLSLLARPNAGGA